MRVSTAAMYQKNLNSILNTQNNWQKAGLQLASGKRILSPSDDPVGASQALMLKQAQARNEQFQATRERVDHSLSRQDTILKEVNSVIHNIQETLVQAGNETLSDEDRANLATQLQGQKDQLVALSNSTDANGNYIFAGTKNDSPPFVVSESGEVSYVGGQSSIKVSIDETREVPVSHTGQQVFMTGSSTKEPDGSPSESNIFASIDNAIEALSIGLNEGSEDDVLAFQEKLAQASRGMNNSMNNVSTVATEGGAILNEVEKLTALGNQLENDYQIQISNIEEIDWYDAIYEYVTLQTNLEAAQKTFLNMQSMSLFQMK